MTKTTIESQTYGDLVCSLKINLLTPNNLQYADIEALVLSGELFNGPERSSSPIRSRSPSPEPEDKGWHDDELVNATADDTNDVAPQESIGMGPGRTGVKGVIRDHNEAQKLSQSKRSQEIAALNSKLEKSALTAKSFLEEERSKPLGEKVDPIIQAERDRWERERTAKRDVFGGLRHGKFGHLREIGLKGFVGAVENEEKGVWVVVHLYDPVGFISTLISLSNDRVESGQMFYSRRYPYTSSKTISRYKISQV